MIRGIKGVVERVDGVVTRVDDVYDSIAGRAPSELIPNPLPGLITVAAGHTEAILETGERVKEMAEEQKRMSDHQIAQNGKVTKIEGLVEGLVQAVVATKEDLGVAAEKVANDAATRQLDVLAAVAHLEPVVPVDSGVHDRREGDPPAS
jgi:hypothetical protein